MDGLVVVGVLAHLQELGPGVAVAVEGGRRDSKVAEDQGLQLLGFFH